MSVFDPELVEALAEAVAARAAELIAASRTEAWLDVGGVARLLSVEPDFVYQHAARLGARRLGDGPKARLRFRREDVEEAFPCSTSRGSPADRNGVAPPIAARRRTRRAADGVALVPVRGSRA